MSREFDDIRKKIDQSHKELYKQDAEISKDIGGLEKNQDKILKEIGDIKKQVKDISTKVDLILDILNSFTIMLSDDNDEENLLDDYADGESWVPEQEEDWNSYEDEDKEI